VQRGVGAIRPTLRRVQMKRALSIARLQGDDGSIGIELPIRIQSEQNLREHWATRARRAKRQRRMVADALLAMGRHRAPPLPVVVTLTRLAPRKLDDDNAVGGHKHVRDQVAAWLGVDDADQRVEWRYAQERANAYACRIAIEERR
jgi:hypothetical protein